MKKTKIYTIIGLSLILTISLNGQALQEKKRAEFLTKYYSEYNLNNNNIDAVEILENESIDNNIDSVRNSVSDSIAEAKRIESINANCLNSLYNENKGVVESAIYVSIQFKDKFPNENSSTLVEALDRIINENDNPRIRYKAQLAKIYITNSDWFENLEINSIEFEKEVYLSIAQTINGKLFSQDF